MEQQFSIPLLAWFDLFGRKDLPWQHPRTPYRVWVSEIMLQQTQVKTVIPYFNRFIQSFPSLDYLANASEDAVLAHWSGLGYYSRARNLHRTAKLLYEKYGGQFPQSLAELSALPGIGASTAAAIASQAFNLPTAILDGNVKRVLCRYFLVSGWPEQSQVKRQLWELANQCMPKEQCADYTQAIMDLGASCCTAKNPSCTICPLNQSCKAYLQQQVQNYPQKKAKKALPTKTQQFLVVYDENYQIYLEKRPPVGLWGGLWCMPFTEADECPSQFLEIKHRFLSQEITELINIKHSFSHFHLLIKAFAIKIKPKQNLVAENGGSWFKMEDISQLGLAKPVSKIIHCFAEKNRLC